jgi:hypothetical protein
MFEHVIMRCVATVLVLAATGCSPDRARYTVDEYRSDASLRHSQMDLCKSDPGSFAKTPDCINARLAAALEDRVRLRDVPPVGLSDKPAPSKKSDADKTTAPAR